MNSVQKTIAYWFERLQFPAEYRPQLDRLMEEITIPEDLTIADLSTKDDDMKYNLLAYLYACDELSRRYAERGIPDRILDDTLWDLQHYALVWSDLKNELCFGQAGWLKYHMHAEIFRLGRLQFQFYACPQDVPACHLFKGDPVLNIHIPKTTPLTPASVDESFDLARKFFARYYPEYHYRGYICHSWTIDPSLKEMLGESSNLVQFVNRFYHVSSREADDVIHYVFRWDSTRENVREDQITTSFSRKIYDRIQAGQPLYAAFGAIEEK